MEQIKKFLHGKGFALLLTASLLAAAGGGGFGAECFRSGTNRGSCGENSGEIPQGAHHCDGRPDGRIHCANQMKEMGVADKYPQLLEEMPRVRAELGYPPLVTPTSQIVGSMSVLNVALGRYKMIPREVKDLILGKYGRTPGPIDPEVKRLAIGDAPQIDHRPADDIPPQMKKLREKLAEEGFPNAPIEDVLSYASFPEVTLNFLRHSNIGMKFHDL